MCTAESASAMYEEKLGRPPRSTGASASVYASTDTSASHGRPRKSRARPPALPQASANPASANVAIR